MTNNKVAVHNERIKEAIEFLRHGSIGYSVGTILASVGALESTRDFENGEDEERTVLSWNMPERRAKLAQILNNVCLELNRIAANLIKE